MTGSVSLASFGSGFCFLHDYGKEDLSSQRLQQQVRLFVAALACRFIKQVRHADSACSSKQRVQSSPHLSSNKQIGCKCRIIIKWAVEVGSKHHYDLSKGFNYIIKQALNNLTNVCNRFCCLYNSKVICLCSLRGFMPSWFLSGWPVLPSWSLSIESSHWQL